MVNRYLSIKEQIELAADLAGQFHDGKGHELDLDVPNLKRSALARKLVGSNPTPLERDFILAMDSPRPLFERFMHEGLVRPAALFRVAHLGLDVIGRYGLTSSSFTAKEDVSP